MCPGVDSASKNEYQGTPGGKVGRHVRVTTLSPLLCRVSRKSGALMYRNPLGYLGLSRDNFIFFYYDNISWRYLSVLFHFLLSIVVVMCLLMVVRPKQVALLGINECFHNMAFVFVYIYWSLMTRCFENHKNITGSPLWEFQILAQLLQTWLLFSKASCVTSAMLYSSVQQDVVARRLKNAPLLPRINIRSQYNIRYICHIISLIWVYAWAVYNKKKYNTFNQDADVTLQKIKPIKCRQ